MDYTEETKKLNSACKSFFGCTVRLSPRAKSAFLETYRTYELFGAQLDIITDFDCFMGAVVNSPACAEILLKNQVTIDATKSRLPKTLASSRVIKLYNYNKLLENIFMQQAPYSSGLTCIGEKIKESRLITEIDIFVGCIESGRHRLYPNETAKNLLIQSGMSSDGYVDEEGEQFLINIEQACSPIIDIDQSHSEQQFILYLDSTNKIRINHFGANTFGILDSEPLPSDKFLFRGGVIQPISSAKLYSKEIIFEFEEMINSTKCSENDFQKFFKTNPHFLTGLEFNSAHSQPILYKDDGGKLIPDFFLEKIDSGWDAILDLKKPYDSMVVRRTNRVYFKQWLQEAISQLQYYREWFESPSNRMKFEDSQKIKTKVYRPKMVIVAGRSHHFLDDVERMRLISNQQNDLVIWTYDDLLSRAKRYNNFLSM